METNLTIVKDYRNTSFKNDDFTLNERKKDFMERFKEAYPRIRNVYRNIKKFDNEYNYEFRQLYFEKCVYCGISTQVIFASNFEVDHVIPVSVLKLNIGYDSEYINGIENLVSSCQMCNRAKSGFLCNDDVNMKLLHPDNNELPQIFERKEDYSIQIKDKHEENLLIQEFYKQLKLDNQLRRLDYLLMEMKDFCEKYEGHTIGDEIQEIVIKLESIRRKKY